MKLTAADLKELKVVDKIIKEPYGGAHNNKKEAAMILKEAIIDELEKLMKCDVNEMLDNRYNKFRKMGTCI